MQFGHIVAACAYGGQRLQDVFDWKLAAKCSCDSFVV